MEELPEIGLRLHGGLNPRSCIDLAQTAEANGFASLWFAENPLQRGVLPAASACALLTRRLRIGLGIINVYSHHPTLIAMEFAALDELANGRARLGIGSGIGRLIERIGFAWQPLAATRDAPIRPPPQRPAARRLRWCSTSLASPGPTEMPRARPRRRRSGKC